MVRITSVYCQIFCALLLHTGMVANSNAQRNFDRVQIQTVDVAPGIYMLVGLGGNIGLSIGADGVFMIDDQYAPLDKKIKQAVSELTQKPVNFLINTHWHGDHTGGNESFAGDGAIVVAHDNVRKRLKAGQFMQDFGSTVGPAPRTALPVVTFADSVTLHWNDDTLEVVHPSPAHTDGDAIIYFREDNVVHAGDLYFNGLYPYIDAGSGGNPWGVVNAVAAILERIDDDTKVIPGHGPLSNKSELQSYHDMLKTLFKRIENMKKQGKTLEQVVAAKPTAKYDEKWGQGFLKPDRWVSIIYKALP